MDRIAAFVPDQINLSRFDMPKALAARGVFDDHFSPVVDASQVIVTIPDDGGELLDDAILHAGIFRQTWKAPEDFVGKDPNPNLKKRKIDFQVYVNGVDLEVPEFNLYKPPVVLIHGIFSGPHMWGMMVHNLKGSGYLAKPIGYCNSCSFQENISTVGTQIKAIIESAKEHDFEEPIVIKKADVVAHSMGGILVCLYIASGSYDDDVNRVISIGTPFSGSQFANYVLNLLMIIPPGDQQFWMGTIQYVLETLMQGSLFRGAVRDLQVGSAAINHFRNRLSSFDFPVPVYAITCDGYDNTPAFPLDLIYWGLDKLDWFYNESQYFGATNNIEVAMFGTNNTDFVVSFDSQRGGSSKYKTKKVVDHMHEADDNNVISQVKELLKSQVSSFDKDGFKPDYLDCSVPPIEPFSIIESSHDKKVTITQNILQEEGNTDFITLVLNPNRTVYEPGENVHVTAECHGIVDAVLFVTPFGWCEDKTAPYEYDFIIDQDFAGEFTIASGALDNAGLIDYKSVSLYSEPRQNLTGIASNRRFAT